MNTMRLAGKVILVTGGGTGLGQAAALRSALEGAKLSLLDVDAAALSGRGRRSARPWTVRRS